MFPFIYNNTWITDDKVLHFIFSFTITFILYNLFRYFYNKKYWKGNYTNKWIFYKIFFIILFIGIIKELRDFVTPGHNAEIMDIIANFIGYFFFLFVLNIKKILRGIHIWTIAILNLFDS
jgi:VanZ family protein